MDIFRRTFQSIRLTEHGGYIADGNIHIPNDPENSDYQAVQAWIAEGNEPEPIPAPTIDELKANKIAEIRAAALAEGQQGANILAAPGVSYHMALTPEDVAYFQQANAVAKIEAQVTGQAFTGEIKEKWPDGRTQLHLSVPEAVHDGVLANAALLCAAITRKQETLVQAVNDAGTAEEVGAVVW